MQLDPHYYSSLTPPLLLLISVLLRPPLSVPAVDYPLSGVYVTSRLINFARLPFLSSLLVLLSFLCTAGRLLTKESNCKGEEKETEMVDCSSCLSTLSGYNRLKEGKMGHLSSMFNGLARSFSIQRGRSLADSGTDKDDGREAAESMAKEAKKKELILRSSGFVNVHGSNNFASVFTKKGQKGSNQDCCIVWEEYGGQPDMLFCGIFDGHGPWGHFVAKMVRESMPFSLLCTWQETLARSMIDPGYDLEEEKRIQWSDIWKSSYLKTCELVDQDLEHHRKIDSFYSGTTALSVVRQGDQIVIANVGDSRAVLATTSDEDGSLVAVQLTVDFKPNLPHEQERITQCNGRVFCLHDEPGIHRLWLPNEESPGLAMSRAFGDYCIKDFGLISEPEVTHRNITAKDQFLVLATDGVWDAVSNQEAVEIVSSAADRAKSAKRLVEYAVRAWKRKRRGIAIDDISAICLFFHSHLSSSSHLLHPVSLWQS